MAFVKKSSVVCLIYLSINRFFATCDECFYSYHCEYPKKYCCKRKYPERSVCQTSCIGEFCTVTSDCATGECCNYSKKKCATNCDECFSNSGCLYRYPRRYCCKRKDPESNVCRASCIGENCTVNSDCATSECCNSKKKCATDCDECSSHTACPSYWYQNTKKYCCKRKYPESNVCQTSCIGESCTVNSDCASGECCNSKKKCATICDECFSNSGCSSSWYTNEYCCKRKYPENNVCRTSCAGESCTVDSNCGSGEYCCDTKCASDCGSGDWIIPVIVISVIISILILIGIFVRFSRIISRRRVYAGIILMQPPGMATPTLIPATEQQLQFPFQQPSAAGTRVFFNRHRETTQFEPQLEQD